MNIADYEKKLNILIVHNVYKISGGEDTVVSNEVQMLENNGHKVFLYTRDNKELDSLPFYKKIFIPINFVFNLKTYMDVKKIIVKNKIDIVHVHNTLCLISPSVYYAALGMHIPVVQTIHNFRLLCPAATFYRSQSLCEDCLKNGQHCAIYHNCYRNSKIQTIACVCNNFIHRLFKIYKRINYICLTEFTKRKMLSLKQIKEENIFIKPNFTYSTFDIKCRNTNKNQKNYFIFVGRIEEIKGIYVLLEAFKSLKSQELIIVGTGSLEDEIKNKIECNKINNIKMLGFKNRDEINKLMRNAKALIMCSQWYETFGMVIIEAYSNGVPAIVGNIGNIKELVIEGVTGELFNYDSAESLCKAIERFEKNKQNSYGENAFKFFEEKFNDKINYIQLYNIYKKIQGDKNV